MAVGRSTRTAVTSLPGFTSRVPDLAGSIDAGLWLSEKEQRDSVRTCVVSESCVARTAERIKVSLREVLVPLWGLPLAGLESLCERRAYADIVPSLGGHPRGGSGRHWRWNGVWWEPR